MKKLLFALLLISGVAFSQNVTQKKETVSQILTSKEWMVDYAIMSGQKIEQFGEMKPMNFVFKADNAYMMDGNKPGKWLYNVKKKTVEIYTKGVLRMNIISLETKAFVATLNAASDKSAPKGLSDIQIFFKPKG